jgi:curved DNA binding protein
MSFWQSIRKLLRLLKNGKGNYDVTEAIQKIAESYKCKPIEGMLSHQLKQFKIDGEKTIIQNPTLAQKKEHEKCEFENYEVYAMDVLISTGEGAGKELDTKVSIYKKTDENYLLKLKASKAFYAEVKKKYGNMPFNLRNFEEEAKAKMGVVECVAHKLIEPFQVLYEKHSEYRFHFTYSPFCVQAKVIKLVGLTRPPFLSPTNLITFACTQNGE